MSALEGSGFVLSEERARTFVAAKAVVGEETG